jgi:hypothetical protein
MTTPNTEALPPEIQARLDRLEELERADAEKRGEYQRLTESQKTKHAGELAKRDEQLGRLSQAFIRSTAERAIRDAKGDIEGLSPHILPFLEARENGRGGVDVVVLDPETKRPRQNIRSGGPMTVDDLVADLRDHRSLGLLFEGAAPRSGFRGVGEKVRNLTREQSRDPKLYAQLKEQVARGEISAVYDDRGFLLLSRASIEKSGG